MTTPGSIHSNDKDSAKKQKPQVEVDDPEQQIQQISPLAIQRAKFDPKSLTPAQVLQLQRTVGNRAVSRLWTGTDTGQHQKVPEKEADTGPVENQLWSQGQTIQRQERDETGNIKGLDMATCWLVGVDQQKEKSFALVKSEAWMSSPTHSVIYEIKWDEAVVPAGEHLGQVKGQASDWVVDKNWNGVAIGDRKDKNAPYFNNDVEMIQDSKAGRYFRFNDAIEQPRLRGGSWWFRLKVADENGTVLSQSHDVEVPWGK